jgi:alkylation response protein AidB-like acyl-CoA dehydrogenase
MNAYERPAALDLSRVARQIDVSVLEEVSCALGKTAAAYDRSGAFPHENFALLRRHGIIGLAAARALAGDPLTLAEARQVVHAVARGEPSTALVLIMTYLFVFQVARNPNWPAALRGQVLEDIALHGTLANALRVEPALGTPLRGGLPDTTARRVAGGWRISGRKLYSTGIPALTWLAVWGRTDDAAPQIGTFLVPAAAEGMRIAETWDQLGMRASGSHDAVLEDVFIPTEYAVDIRPPTAWEAERAPETVAWMSVLLGTLYDAVARNARDWLLQFVSERTPSNLGAALATLPRFQEAIGEIDAILYASQTLLDRSTTTDPAHISPVESNFVKMMVTNNAINVTEKAISLVGNPALSRANPLERYYRDTLAGRVHSPQNDMILIGAGKFALASFASRKAR